MLIYRTSSSILRLLFYSNMTIMLMQLKKKLFSCTTFAYVKLLLFFNLGIFLYKLYKQFIGFFKIVFFNKFQHLVVL